MATTADLAKKADAIIEAAEKMKVAVETATKDLSKEDAAQLIGIAGVGDKTGIVQGMLLSAQRQASLTAPGTAGRFGGGPRA